MTVALITSALSISPVFGFSVTSPLQLQYDDARARCKEPDDVVVWRRVPEGATPDGTLDDPPLRECGGEFEATPEGGDVPGHEDGPQQPSGASIH